MIIELNIIHNTDIPKNNNFGIEIYVDKEYKLPTELTKEQLTRLEAVLINLTHKVISAANSK